MTFLKLRYIISVSLFFAMYAVLIPYFQIFLYGKGLSPTVTGTMLGVWEIAGIAGPLVLGSLIDRTGSFRRVLLLATAVIALVITLMVRIESLFLLFITSAVLGFAFKPILSINDSMISHGLPDPEHDYGHVRVSGSIGFALVMLFFEVTGIFDSPTPRMIAGGTLIFALLYALSLAAVPPVRRPSVTAEEVPGSPETGIPPLYFILMTALLLGRMGFASYYSFFSIFLQEELGVANVGIFWMIAVVAEVLPIMFAGKLIRSVGRYRAAAAGLTAMIIRMLIYSFTTSLVIIGAAQLLHSLTFGFTHAAAISYINEKVPAGRKTFAMSFYTAFAWGLAAFIGSPLAGLLIERFGFPVMYRTMTVLPLLGLLLLTAYELKAAAEGRERLGGRSTGLSST